MGSLNMFPFRVYQEKLMNQDSVTQCWGPSSPSEGAPEPIAMLFCSFGTPDFQINKNVTVKFTSLTNLSAGIEN